MARKAMARNRSLLTAALGLLAAAMQERAEGDIVVSLDDANPVVVRPASGSTKWDFTGTVTVSTGTQRGAGRGWSVSPLTLTEAGKVSALRPNGGLGMLDSLLKDGGTYTGTLFSLNIASNKPLGLYTGGLLELWSSNAGSAVAAFTVDLRDSAPVLQPLLSTAVPEPSTLAAAGAGLAVLLAYGRLRRSRVQAVGVGGSGSGLR